MFIQSSQGPRLAFCFPEKTTALERLSDRYVGPPVTMVLSQTCQPLCPLSDRAALAAASLSVARSRPKLTLLSEKAGCPTVSDPPWSPPVPCHPKEGPAFHMPCPCIVHSHWGLLCYLKTHHFRSTVEEVT